MRKIHALSSFTLAAALVPALSMAAPEDKLVELINAYRAAPGACEGVRDQPLSPLAPDARLKKLKISEGQPLQKAMRDAGYQAARAEALTISGPSNAEDVMRFAAQQNCSLLLSQRYSVIGVSRRGQHWQIVMAQPLLHSALGDWRKAGQEVLKLTNAARAKGRNCGNSHYGPARPLQWNPKLGAAALKHSQDMARHSYFAHEGRDGSTAGSRTQAEGYVWRRIGENVAAGQGSAEQVVEGWLSSPGHCANIMNGNFTEMGAGYASNPKSDSTIYWTQVFGTPR